MAGQEIKAGRAVVEVSLRDRVGKGLVAIERKLAATGRNIATLGAALAGGGLAAVAWPLKLAADMEMLRARFTTLTKSATITDALLEQIKKTAAATPFDTKELSDAAYTLLALGSSTKTVVSELTMLGDVSSAIGQPLGEMAAIYGKARTNGKLFSEDINQLGERGIPIVAELAKQFGVQEQAIREMVSEGKIGFGNLQTALQSLTTGVGVYAGGMERASKTSLGRVSTIMDDLTSALTDFGSQLLTSLSPALDFVGRVTGAMRGFVAANSGVLKILGLVAVGVGAVGGLLVGVGLGAMALSSLIGGLALAWGFLNGTIAAIFSPMGAVIALLGLAAVVAFNFRSAIASALSGIAEYFAPVGAAIYRVYEIFATTFGGILAALGGGQLQAAAGIAWLGFVAVAWQAIAELGTAIDAGINYLQAWIPGLDSVKQYAFSVFGSIGKAILAGRWDLAGAIMMEKLKLAWQVGLDFMRDLFDMFITGNKMAFRTLSDFIVDVWQGAIQAIARGLTWVMEATGLAAEGTMQELERMQAAENKARQSKRDKREDPMAGMFDRMNQRGDQRNAMQAKIAELERQSNQAYVDAGAPTIADAAGSARKQLDEAMKAAEAERTAAASGGDKFKPNLPSLAANAGQQMKVESKGTFSAAAATLFGLGGNDAPQQQTAANTRRMAIGITQLNDKLGAGATV